VTSGCRPTHLIGKGQGVACEVAGVVEAVRHTYRLRPGRFAWLRQGSQNAQQQTSRTNGAACPACGYTADRDLSAARTILATAERDRASADDVRHQIASLQDGGQDAVRAGKSPDSSVGCR
jgi:hypothetical protein